MSDRHRAGLDAELERLPWRGPGQNRPKLPVPPRRLPLRWGGRWRKRWRYIGAYDDAFMLCAAVVHVGPGAQTFWALWDREGRRMRERTRKLLPLARREVSLDGPRVAVHSGDVEIDLALASSEPIETICPNGEGGYTWTRKRAGFSVTGRVAVAGAKHRFDGRGVDDESAGYHARRTSWLWSAGVGEAADGRPAAWNLVSGINDPPARSERAIWIDGRPSEPEPVSFEGLDAIAFADGSRLRFEAESVRAHSEAVPPLFRSDYEAPFGSFAGSLAGTALASGLGVMERHDAVW
ncbi:MAG: DUF2804 family protein [Solirubrobacterales bacterium]